MVRHHFRFGSHRWKAFAYGMLLIVFVALLAFFFSLRSPKYMLLSFDVEPVDGPESVMRVIDFLVVRNANVSFDKRVNVTFFVTGEYALKNRDVIARMKSEGFEIACHSFSHPLFLKLNESQKRDEIFRCQRALDIAGGITPRGFRAPYTLVDRETIHILKRNHWQYDASTLWYTNWLYGSQNETRRISVSTVGLIPLQDVIWIRYLGSPTLFFWMLSHPTSEVVSVILHPHHTIRYLNDLEESIDALLRRNVSFISYYHFTEVTNGSFQGLAGP